MTKAEYRRYFRMMKSYVKLTKFCELAGVHRSSFSQFLNDETGRNDWCISVQKLELLRTVINETLQNIA